MWEGIISGIFMVIVAIIEAISYKERKQTKEFTEKMNLGQYLNQSERGKTKVICSAWLCHSVISVNTVISFFLLS